jgi:hypothetical protein
VIIGPAAGFRRVEKNTGYKEKTGTCACFFYFPKGNIVHRYEKPKSVWEVTAVSADYPIGHM